MLISLQRSPSCLKSLVALPLSINTIVTTSSLFLFLKFLSTAPYKSFIVLFVEGMIESNVSLGTECQGRWCLAFEVAVYTGTLMKKKKIITCPFSLSLGHVSRSVRRQVTGATHWDKDMRKSSSDRMQEKLHLMKYCVDICGSMDVRQRRSGCDATPHTQSPGGLRVCSQ